MNITKMVTIFIFLTLAADAVALEFKVKSPASWQLISSDEQGAIYKNSRSSNGERVVIQSVLLQADSLELERSLSEKREMLMRAREHFYRLFGLNNYFVVSIVRRPITRSGFNTVDIIQSRYVDLANKEVQMIERQYLNGHRLMIITYLIDAMAVPDYGRVETVMDYFQPARPLGRAPASEVLGSSSTQTKSLATSKSDPAGLSLVKDLDMSNPANQKRCESIMGDRARKNSDPGFLESVDRGLSSSKAGSCLMGVIDNAWGIVKGAATMFCDAARYLNPFNNSYRGQVNSTIGVIASEIIKSPHEFARRVAAEVWATASQTAGDFFYCKTSEDQVRDVCNIASNFIPVGILAKIVTKAPLAAAEAAKAAKIVDDAVGVDKTKAVAHAAGEAKTVEVVRDGSRTHSFDNGITVKVSDSPQTANTERSNHTLDDKSGTALPAAFPPPSRISALNQIYGDLLKGIATNDETMILLDRLDGKVDRARIRDTLKRAQYDCLVR